METATIETVAPTESPIFIQNVRQTFFVIVYFDSQYDADRFQDAFDGLSADGEDPDFESEDLKALFERLADDTDKQFEDFFAKLEPSEGENLDANQIRALLEGADLDLADDDLTDLKDWFESNRSGELDVPRGVFKILEVEDGKATIQGDDVDRRIVEEPDDTDNNGVENEEGLSLIHI